MTRLVEASTANRNWSEILRTVEGGEDIVLTRYGRPVAWIGPPPPGLSVTYSTVAAGSTATPSMSFTTARKRAIKHLKEDGS